MARLHDWEARLADHLTRYNGAVVDYENADCARFGAEGAEAVTGRDYYGPFRGQYANAIGSVRVLKEIGDGTLEETFDARFPPVAIGFAKRGDLVFDGEAVGICVGVDAVFLPLPNVVGVETEAGLEKVTVAPDVSIGYVRKPRNEWKKAWTVE